mgnify:CR=1 FL=1
MSRIGKNPIVIPSGVEVKIENGIIEVKGPKGVLTQVIHPLVKIEKIENSIIIKIQNESDRLQKALWGLFGSLIKNMIIGVTNGFVKKLEINGVGMKASISGKKLILNVGFSHPVEFTIPQNIEITVDGNVITVSGIDKQLVGETAAQIRKIKKVEPYKGKGIKYVGEQFIRKAGKAAVKGK